MFGRGQRRPGHSGCPLLGVLRVSRCGVDAHCLTPPFNACSGIRAHSDAGVRYRKVGMSHIEGRTGTVTKPVGGSHASPVTADLTEPLSTRIDNTELRRRLWHMSPGALSFFLWAFPHRDPISPTLRAARSAILIIGSMCRFPGSGVGRAIIAGSRQGVMFSWSAPSFTGIIRSSLVTPMLSRVLAAT